MDKPIELIHDNIRLIGKSWGLIFKDNLNKLELYEYYIKKIKPVKNYKINIFVSWDTMYDSIPNTSVIIDFGIKIDRTNYSFFIYNGIIPDIRRVSDDNFLTVLNEMSKDPDIYPVYKKKNIVFSFPTTEDSIKNDICIECRKTRYGYEFSSDGLRCKFCTLKPNDIEIKRKTFNDKLNEMDPHGSSRQFIELYLNYRESFTENKIKSFEIKLKNYEEHLTLFSKFMETSKTVLNKDTFDDIYNKSIAKENTFIGMLIINLGTAEKYRNSGMFRISKDTELKNKVIILFEFTDDKDKFKEAFEKRYETFTEFKIEYSLFKSAHSNATLECMKNYITPLIDANKDIFRIKCDIFSNNYDNLLIIDKFKVNFLHCLIDS